MPKVKIEKDLYEKVKQFAEKAGYSSTEEFLTHLLEKIVIETEPGETDGDLLKRLQGLGYIS